jgi:TRAP-type C4-dicarboxylate transport system substrate-binding protein
MINGMLFGLWAVTTVIVGGNSSAQEITLTALTFLPPNVNFAIPFKRFVDKVNAEGKGLVQMRLLGPESIPQSEQGNALRTGVVDVAALNPGVYKTQVPEADVIYSTRHYSLAEMRKNGAFDVLNTLHTEKLNSRILTVYCDDVPMQIYMVKPVSKLDLRGFKVRTGSTFVAFLQALNASPVIIPPGEVYTALERGVVDGFTWPIWGLFDQGWDKYIKYRLDPGFQNSSIYVLFNNAKWNSLRPDQRSFLERMTVWLETEDYPAWSANYTSTERKRQDDAGVKAVDLGPELFAKADAALWDAAAQANPTLIGRVRPLIEKRN